MVSGGIASGFMIGRGKACRCCCWIIEIASISISFSVVEGAVGVGGALTAIEWVAGAGMFAEAAG